ncbi:hypothetical protein CK203_062229 [Vitis vinifera]|uniref:HAT C-terminal dimerisation domain-containing protein n=1 Tax=Vitis vinifera TaxID=29760 RepID=A0A438G996_VITVI|nr:hypothetical protein CK203_062229 [Vitis vinifera]
MPFVYKLIGVMKENFIRLNAKEWVLEIIADPWDITLKHPLHAVVEWWFMYGNHTPTLRRLAIKVLSQTASPSTCERNWSTDMEAENDKVAKKDYLDLLDIAAEVGEEEEDNQLFQWVRSLRLDDEDGNPDPRIVAHV